MMIPKITHFLSIAIALGALALLGHGYWPAVVTAWSAPKVETKLVHSTSVYPEASNGFSRVPMSYLADRFNRANPKIHIVLDMQVGARRVSGSFDFNDVASFLELLERDPTLKVRRSGNTVIVTEVSKP